MCERGAAKIALKMLQSRLHLQHRVDGSGVTQPLHELRIGKHLLRIWVVAHHLLHHGA